MKNFADGQDAEGDDDDDGEDETWGTPGAAAAGSYA
jgi:hypothetical protein